MTKLYDENRILKKRRKEKNIPPAVNPHIKNIASSLATVAIRPPKNIKIIITFSIIS